MRPLISIVIPTYNRARDLERALKSVIAQTYPNWEALVVDNHSSDNTDDLVRDLNDSRTKIFKINNGGVIAASRNLGIKHAKGEYLAFLDSDDWWTPKKLEESLKYLEQGADVVYHDLFLARRAGQRIFRRTGCVRELKSPAFDDLMVNGNALINSSVIARTKLLRAIGGLSEAAASIAMEDYDAWLRLARITERFKLVPKTLGYYWKGGGNASNPGRTIRYLDAFEKQYANDINRLSVAASIWWIPYSKGRAYYRLGSYAMAKATLARIHWRRVPLAVAVKTLWMLSVIGLFHSSDKAQEGT